MAHTFEANVWNKFPADVRNLHIKVCHGSDVYMIPPGQPLNETFSLGVRTITLEFYPVSVPEPGEEVPVDTVEKYFHGSSTTEYNVETKIEKWGLTITNPDVEPFTDSSSTTNVSMGEDQV